MALGRVQHMGHQRAAVPAALDVGTHRDRADHDQRRRRTIRAAMRDGPALDRPGKRAVLDQREAHSRDRRAAFAQAIGGTAEAVRTEGRVEQMLDRRMLYRRQWK